MSEQPDTSPPEISQIKAELHELAKLIRAADHLEPNDQQAIADLLDELRVELDAPSVDSVHAAHLGHAVTELARSLHDQHTGVLVRARHRVEEAVGRAEAESPVIAGVVRRFVDALASIGI